MSNLHFDSYDDLRFSDAAKDRLTRAVAQGVASSRLVGSDDRGAAPLRAPVRSGKRARRPFAVAVAAAAAALAIGGAAYATGAFVTVGEFAADMFGGVADTQVVDSIGHPVEASASSGGVTVTADAIIGDRENYAVVYSIVRDDGQPFDLLETTEDGLILAGFDTYDADFGMNNGSNGSMYFYDADPADNAIQMVDRCSIDISGGSIVGKTMRAHFEGLYAYGADDTMVRLADGTWDLRFKVDYEDTSIDLPAGQDVSYNGLSGVVKSARISPIALTFDLVVNEAMDWEEQSSGQMSDHNSQLVDRFLNTPDVVVTMRDGSSVIGHDLGGGTTEDLGDATLVHKAVTFDEIVDVDQIVSVAFCGTDVPISE
ncbi:Uncharacterised protein [Slackia heliotrinireducens]|uniref:Uncharacterized protein n=1 Tax=Slackia heliotrinireducens (strain ATCC 29202 / DSM 20476 / NCTC 11029 / RHS 1) TaxID=471855 RepID=C7N573_SLAHD|nr:DUF4179 domain-containing protein [Slackia heliotrinireducens]ACV22058.1 hypothetical protein Shel_10230 [Slackia heliotrinireducens DSM 20476]VEH00020.1 Uncharacterised protein [Slackia heliotrinireducens]